MECEGMPRTPRSTNSSSSGRQPPAPARRCAAAQPADPLLELVVEEFLYACQQALSADSLRSYRGVLRVFCAYLEEQLGRASRLGDFTLPSVQRWAMSLQQRPRWEQGGRTVGTKPVAVETRRTYLRTLRTFSNWLVKPPHTYCAEPPLRHLLLPRASDTFKLPLTEEELARLLAAAAEDSVFGARDIAMLLLLIDGAVRARELCRLRIGDVTLQTGLLLVARGKGNKTRAVTVGDETRLALRRYAVVRDSVQGADRSPEAPFFQTLHHRAFGYDGLRSWLRRITARAGVPRAHLHLFRHTSAVDTLDAGADVRTVQLKLGHASIATTQRYLNMASKRLSERQKEFSPVDRLKLTQSARGERAKQPDTPLWRRSDGGRGDPGNRSEER
jgi:integrase/recombinase XerD